MTRTNHDKQPIHDLGLTQVNHESFSTQHRDSSSTLGVLSPALPEPFMKGTQWAMDRFSFYLKPRTIYPC